MMIELLTSPWCGMCATMKRMLGDSVEVVDVVAHPERRADVSLETVPVLVFRTDDGKKLGEHSGFMPKSKFEELVRKYEDESARPTD